MTPDAPARFDLAVFIGRFQPFHVAHAATVAQGLSVARHVVVLVGSAHEPRTFFNPFSAEERAGVIEATFGHHPRLHTVALENSHYDVADWVARADAAVADAWMRIRTAEPDAPATPTVALLGHRKDETTFYLDLFPRWTPVPAPATLAVDATDVRQALFGDRALGFGLLDALEAKAKDEAEEKKEGPPLVSDAQAWADVHAFLRDEDGNRRDGKNEMREVDAAFLRTQLDVLARQRAGVSSEGVDLDGIAATLARPGGKGHGTRLFFDRLAQLDPGVARLWQAVQAAQASGPDPGERVRHFLFDYERGARDRAWAYLAAQRALQGTGAEVLPEATVDFLEAFLESRAYQPLALEYAHVWKAKHPWRHSPYAPQFHTADPVIVQSGHVLMVRRDGYPGRGLWAFPGGFVEEDEPIERSMFRELEEETGFPLPPVALRPFLRAREVFDAPRRSSRGRTVTTAFLLSLPDGPWPKVTPRDGEATAAEWRPIATLRRDEVFEDHYAILHKLLKDHLGAQPELTGGAAHPHPGPGSA